MEEDNSTDRKWLYALAGLFIGAHHLINLLLHALSTVLLFLAFKEMTQDKWKSALAAALFALHPLHVESVAWFSQRKDTLSAFFWSLALLSYVYRYKEKYSYRNLTVFIFYALSLTAKPTVLTFPFVLLLLDYWPLKRLKGGEPRLLLRLVKEKWALFGLTALFGGITLLTRGEDRFEAITLALRTQNALSAYLNYFFKTIWPQNLSVFYPYNAEALSFLNLLIAVSLLTGISYWAFKIRKTSPQQLIGWLWFLGMLFPVIGIIQVGTQAMADRFSYLPLMGLFIMFCWGIPKLMDRYNANTASRLSLALILLGALILSTRKQLSYWTDSLSLFNHSIALNPNNSMAHNNLARAYNDANNTQAAIRHYEASLSIRPDSDKTHINLGVLLDREKKPERAVDHFRKALALNPKNAKAHNNLANILADQKRWEEALSHYQASLKIQPLSPLTHSNIGSVYFEKGELNTAVRYWEKSLQIQPGFRIAERNLTIVQKLLKSKRQR